jgi:hypothetical protein
MPSKFRDISIEIFKGRRRRRQRRCGFICLRIQHQKQRLRHFPLYAYLPRTGNPGRTPVVFENSVGVPVILGGRRLLIGRLFDSTARADVLGKPQSEAG